MLESLHKGAQCSLDKSWGCKRTCCLPAPFFGISITDLDWKHKKKGTTMDLCHFFLILYLSPAPGRKEEKLRAACLDLCCVHLIHSMFVFFSSFLCLQLEEPFRWECLPNLCCEAVKNPQGRCRFLWESSLLISRDAKSSSERHQLCPYPPCPSPSGNSKRKGGKKRKKTPKKDPRFWLSCWHLIAPVQRCIIFVSCFLFL